MVGALIQPEFTYVGQSLVEKDGQTTTEYQYSFKMKPTELPPPDPEALRFKYENPAVMNSILEGLRRQRDEEIANNEKANEKVKHEADSLVVGVLLSDTTPRVLQQLMCKILRSEEEAKKRLPVWAIKSVVEVQSYDARRGQVA